MNRRWPGQFSPGHYALAIVGVLTSVVAVFVYLRVVVMMYMAEGTEPVASVRLSQIASTALAVSVLAVFYLGLLPTRLIDLAVDSIQTIF